MVAIMAPYDHVVHMAPMAKKQKDEILLTGSLRDANIDFDRLFPNFEMFFKQFLSICRKRPFYPFTVSFPVP